MLSHKEIVDVFYNLHIAPKIDPYLKAPYPHVRRPQVSTKSLAPHYSNDHDRIVNVLKTFYFWHTTRTRGIVYAAAKFLPNAYLQIRLIETYWYRKLGLKDPHKRRYRRHSDEEIRKILELRKKGLSYYKIAKELDLPTSYVYYVVKGKIRRARKFLSS